MSIHHNDVSGYRQTVGSSTTQTPAISHTEHVLCNSTADNIDYHEDERSNQSTLNPYAKPFNWLETINEDFDCKPTPLEKRTYAIKVRFPHDVTGKAIERRYFHEYFCASGDLQNCVVYRCTIQIMDKKHKLFTHTSIDGEEDLFIFNTELHRAGASDDIVYVVGSVSPLIFSRPVKPKWIMGQFMTGDDISEMYGIHGDELPSKLKLKQLPSVISHKDFWQNIFFNFTNTFEFVAAKLRQIGSIPSRKSSLSITVTPGELRRSLRNAIHNISDKNLYQIICLDKGRQSYSAGMLLRIQLEDEWIGLSFRYRKMGKNKNNKKSLQFAKFCLDNIDIQRKLALVKPCITGKEYPLFSNFAKINIIDDVLCTKTKLFKYRYRTEVTYKKPLKY